MPFNIGWMELVVILVVALIIFGPGKLPDVGKAVGKTIREFKLSVGNIDQDIKEIQKDLKKEVDDLKSTVDFKDVTASTKQEPTKVELETAGVVDVATPVEEAVAVDVTLSEEVKIAASEENKK